MEKEQGNNETLSSQQSDVLNKVTSFRYSEELKNVMVRDVYTCKDSDLTAAVAAEMSKRRISSAVVVNKEGRISGIVTER
ncbi:MAG: CBS domain-containing protein, partial [Nitrospirota bacterium]